MKKIVLILLIMSVVGLCESSVVLDSSSKASIPTASPNYEEVLQTMRELKVAIEDLTQNNRCYDRYKLYPTSNMYNFIKLDTRTGIMTMVQWGLNDGKEFEYTLNENSLVYEWNDYGCGTFTLYPTTNHYQFLLLNKVDGRQWHVQWGFEERERWIRRIY